MFPSRLCHGLALKPGRPAKSDGLAAENEPPTRSPTAGPRSYVAERPGRSTPPPHLYPRQPGRRSPWVTVRAFASVRPGCYWLRRPRADWPAPCRRGVALPDASFGRTEGRRGASAGWLAAGRVASRCCSRRRLRPCPAGGRQAAPLALGRERPGRSSKGRLLPKSRPTKKGSEAAPELCPSAPRSGRLEPAPNRPGRRPRRRPLRQLPRKKKKKKQQ